MPWFLTPVTIYVETEALSIKDAVDGAENLVIKRVLENEFGSDRNDRSRVSGDYVMGETELVSDVEDVVLTCESCWETFPDDMSGKCPNCGAEIKMDVE